MDLGKLFGLPAHPLLVHLPVMLVPLVAIGAIWIALSPRMRARIGWVVVVLAGVAVVGSQLAAGSGETLEEALETSGKEAGATLQNHASLGNTFVWFALVLFVAVLGLMIRDRRQRGKGDAPAAKAPAALVLAGVVIVASVLAAVRVYQVGHSGAKSVWEGDATSLDFSGGEDGEGSESGETGEAGESGEG